MAEPRDDVVLCFKHLFDYIRLALDLLCEARYTLLCGPATSFPLRLTRDTDC
jgi:hypothetical protein